MVSITKCSVLKKKYISFVLLSGVVYATVVYCIAMIQIPTFKKEIDKYCPTRRQVNSLVEDLLCMKPMPYLQNYKNPCWRKNGQLKCFPYFMLIGMDKCGTTDLFSRIIKHPEILAPSIQDTKETQWWSWKRYGNHLIGHRKRETLADYIFKFKNATKKIDGNKNSSGYHYLITGDGTPMDLWDFRGWQLIPQNFNKKEPEVLTPHLIHHFRPEMKFIILLRNPVDRLYSDYFFLELGKPDSRAFDRAVVSSIQILKNCTNLYSLRKCLFDKDLHLKWNYQARIHLGFYSVYIKEWLKVFSRKQFLIIQTEDYSRNIMKTMSKVFQFLDTEVLDKSKMERYGILSKERKYITQAKLNTGSMSTTSKKLLTNLYKPFNQVLVEMLGDTNFLWSDQND